MERQVGPFVLGKLLGSGTSGKVFQAYHANTGFMVAVKVVSKENAELWQKSKKLIRREIAIMRLLEHDHVLKLYDVYETQRKIYLVVEHSGGGELFEHIMEHGKLPRAQALRFLAQLTSALLHCHAQSIVHRDLKPENILLDTERQNIKLADFGLSSLLGPAAVLGFQDDIRTLHTRCGSPHYASPEVIEGKYDGKRSDIWSAGVVLYAMMTGSLPFNHESLPVLLRIVHSGVFTIPAEVDEPVADLIRKMLTVDPEKRIKLQDIQFHPAMTGVTLPVPSVPPRLQRRYSDGGLQAVDQEIIKEMSCLGIGRKSTIRLKLADPAVIIISQPSESAVLAPVLWQQSTERMIYDVLLSRKRRRQQELRHLALTPRRPSARRLSDSGFCPHQPVNPGKREDGGIKCLGRLVDNPTLAYPKRDGIEPLELPPPSEDYKLVPCDGAGIMPRYFAERTPTPACGEGLRDQDFLPDLQSSPRPPSSSATAAATPSGGVSSPLSRRGSLGLPKLSPRVQRSSSQLLLRSPALSYQQFLRARAGSQVMSPGSSSGLGSPSHESSFPIGEEKRLCAGSMQSSGRKSSLASSAAVASVLDPSSSSAPCSSPLALSPLVSPFQSPPCSAVRPLWMQITDLFPEMDSVVHRRKVLGGARSPLSRRRQSFDSIPSAEKEKRDPQPSLPPLYEPHQQRPSLLTPSPGAAKRLVFSPADSPPAATPIPSPQASAIPSWQVGAPQGRREEGEQ